MLRKHAFGQTQEIYLYALEKCGRTRIRICGLVLFLTQTDAAAGFHSPAATRYGRMKRHFQQKNHH